jgi:hypothetical protein
VRDLDYLYQRLFNLNYRGADVKRNLGRPVTCNAWAREERYMLRRALGVSLLTVLQRKIESRQCLIRFKAVKSFSLLSDIELLFLNLGVDSDQKKRYESLSVAGYSA